MFCRNIRQAAVRDTVSPKSLRESLDFFREKEKKKKNQRSRSLGTRFEERCLHFDNVRVNPKDIRGGELEIEEHPAAFAFSQPR